MDKITITLAMAATLPFFLLVLLFGIDLIKRRSAQRDNELRNHRHHY